MIIPTEKAPVERNPYFPVLHVLKLLVRNPDAIENVSIQDRFLE